MKNKFVTAFNIALEYDSDAEDAKLVEEVNQLVDDINYFLMTKFTDQAPQLAIQGDTSKIKIKVIPTPKTLLPK